MDKRIKVFTSVDEIVNAEVGKPSRRVKKFYLLKMGNLITFLEKPSHPRKINFAEKLTDLNAKKILR